MINSSVRSTGDKTPNKRQLTDQAIALAMQGDWERAVEVNRQLLTFYPHEIDALNRLGKALSELGLYREAYAAYEQALQQDPGNSIAQRNVVRLRNLALQEDTPRVAAVKSEHIDPRLFVEEQGRTVIAPLEERAPATVLARVTSGDIVYLRPEGRTLYITNASGEVLGHLESRLGDRLIGFMDLGNRYIAAIKSVSDSSISIFIREIYQDPSVQGTPSFARTIQSVGHDDDEELTEYDEMQGEELDHGAERDDDEESDGEDGDDSLEHELGSGFTIEEEDV
ncbi:MAG: tetratricopeptide repeat protein [Chloroflexi bacterium]|nr:tetratricopeptide repeat protein [Chloroflexota bacterium]